VHHIIGGFQYGGLRQLHTVGLLEGFGSHPVAQSYLAEVLEPTLNACKQRLEVHIARGEMKETDARHAAINLISPLLIVFLHQNALGGSKEYPLDIAAFASNHIEAFVTAYQKR